MTTTSMSALGRVDVYSDERALGQIGQFPDYDNSVIEMNVSQSGTPIFAIYVMNDSGGTLAPGLGCVYKAGFAGKRVGGLHSANSRCDGIVDPKLSSAVPNGSYFWLILQGPIDVEIGTGGITAGAVVQTIASGKFAGGTAGTAMLGHSGISIGAANDGSRARVALNPPFAAIKATG